MSFYQGPSVVFSNLPEGVTPAGVVTAAYSKAHKAAFPDEFEEGRDYSAEREEFNKWCVLYARLQLVGFKPFNEEMSGSRRRGGVNRIDEVISGFVPQRGNGEVLQELAR